MTRAAKQRHTQQGMNLSERLRRNQNVITIPRQQITNLTVKETLCFSDGQSMFEFEIPELSKYSNDLLIWLTGSVAE